MTYTTPDLPYEYNALEPVMTEETLRTHHGKHHPAYTAKLNATLEGHKELAKNPPEWFLTNFDKVPEAIRQKVRNFVGGHLNHTFFWECMKKDVLAEGPAVDAIVQQWGSLDAFKEEFTNSAATLFGSGWTWLVKEADGKLAVVNTMNQDSPVTDGQTPLLVIDVWEHSFYIQYRQDKVEYIKDWWQIVNWQFVNEQFEK